MKKIKSQYKIALHADGNKYYVGREILSFCQNSDDSITAVYKEYLFDIVPVENEETKEMTMETKVISELPESTQDFKPEEVDLMARMMKLDITSENFTENFNKLQTQALLFDTLRQGDKGRYGTKKWEIVE